VPSRLHQLRPFAGLVAALLVVAACAGKPFSTDGPCEVDGALPGAYPALEAPLPLEFEGRAADIRNSGRNCTDDALGTLKTHGVDELRFGGATWDFGGGRAATFAVMALPDEPLPVEWIEELYEYGARTGRKTDNVEVTRPTIEGIGPVFKLEVLNDLSLQTIVVWPDGDRVRDLLVSTQVTPSASRADHDAFLTRALAAAAAVGDAKAGI